MKKKEQKKEVAYYMRRLYDKGLTTTSGGNVSARGDDGLIYITPSQTDKGRLKGKEVAIMSMVGENHTPEINASMETKMHLAIYAVRPDVMAIIHAHPIFGTSYSISKKEMSCSISGEARAILGEVKYADYELMSTSALAENVANALKEGNVALMKNHGVISVGKNLLQAFDRLEVLEATAKISFITEVLGARNELSENEAKDIDDFIKNL